MDVGSELRQARERRGLSLQQISHITKISLRVLQVIEAADQSRLPAPVFTRAFVKSYAAEVGLDPEETMRRYLSQFDAGDAPAAQAEPEAEPSGAVSSIPSSGVVFRSAARVLRGRFGGATVMAIALIGALALMARRPPASEHPNGPLAQTPVSAAGLAPVGPETAAVGTSGTLPPPAGILHITIAPTGPCWASATVGDQRVFASLLNPGVHKSVETDSDVSLRIGDPVACAFTINGKAARVPGAPGQATTVHVTKDNYGQFLAR